MDIFKEYKTLFEDKSKIKKVVKEMDVDKIFDSVNEISDFSSDYITNLWKTGKKVCRTQYVIDSMKDTYPYRILNISLAIDAAVNNLDELLDENLTKEKKAIHIIELSKNIGYIQDQHLTKKQRKAILTYFKDKIPIIAGGEKYYTSKIENAKDENEILHLGKKFYDTRIIDMDIFIELPLIENKIYEEYNKILKSSRGFRAVNLIKKDLKDMEKDENNEINTLFTIVKQKNLDPKYYAKKIASEYFEELKKIKSCNKITNNFHDMCKKDLKELSVI